MVALGAQTLETLRVGRENAGDAASLVDHGGIAEALHRPIDPGTPIPDAYLVFVQDLLGRNAPGRMTDGRDPWGQPFERHYNPEDPLDKAIMETRRAVFPHWGLVADPFGAF